MIVNPLATGVEESRLAAVRAVLPDGTELRMTSAKGEATEIAREVSGRVDALYVFCGDGTYNEVLNGSDGATPLGNAGSQVPGGILPIRPSVALVLVT